MTDVSPGSADVQGARSPMALDHHHPLLVLETDAGAPNFYVRVSAAHDGGRRVARFELVRGGESANHGLRWNARKDQDLLVVRFVLDADVQEIQVPDAPAYVELGPVREGEQRTQKMKVGKRSSHEHFSFNVVFSDGLPHDPIMVVTPF